PSLRNCVITTSAKQVLSRRAQLHPCHQRVARLGYGECRLGYTVRAFGDGNGSFPIAAGTAQTRLARRTLAARLFARTRVGRTAIVGVRLWIYARAPATHHALLALHLTLTAFAQRAGRALHA